MSSTGVPFGLLLHHTSIKEAGKQIQHKAACVYFTNLCTYKLMLLSENWMDRMRSFTYFSSFLPRISQVGSMLPWWWRRTSLFNSRNAPLTLELCSAAIILCTLVLLLFTIFVEDGRKQTKGITLILRYGLCTQEDCCQCAGLHFVSLTVVILKRICCAAPPAGLFTKVKSKWKFFGRFFCLLYWFTLFYFLSNNVGLNTAKSFTSFNFVILNVFFFLTPGPEQECAIAATRGWRLWGTRQRRCLLSSWRRSSSCWASRIVGGDGSETPCMKPQ